jgi:hypothetical protein
MKQALYTVLFCVAILMPLHADPDPNQPIPDPHRLQDVLWQVSKLDDFRLEGFLHTGENKFHPVIMRTKGRLMQFEFKDTPLQIRVRITTYGSAVFKREKSSEPWKLVTGEDRLKPILDSDISYEDIGVDFLRWENIKPIGLDSIMTLKAWAYESKPSELSRYAKARFWISADYLAVLRVDAYNTENQIIKRVEVNGVQKVGKCYVIKEMMVSTMIPGRDISKSRTYLEIREAKPGSGLKDDQ